MSAKRFGITSLQPSVRYRVLATDWEAETSIEAWTENLESAEAVARALTVRDVSVQIDRLASMPVEDK